MATFCLIHGNWHDGSCWEPVGERLRARGYDVHAPDMPFDDPHADYAERARPAVEALDGAEDPVIVGHSVGSAEAALVAERCRAALLVYVCPRYGSFAAPPDAPQVFRSGFPFPPRDAEGRMVWDPQAAIAAMYPRLDPEVQRQLVAHLRPGAGAVGEYPLREPPDVRTELLYTTDDEFFTPEWERFVAHRLLRIEPIELPGGHFPMLEDPERVADLLDRLASRDR